MAKGKDCPHCSKQTFHDKGSYKECSICGYLGWAWQQPVRAVGKGKGNKCPNCWNQTLHRVYEPRCGVCDFSGVEPAAAS